MCLCLMVRFMCKFIDLLFGWLVLFVVGVLFLLYFVWFFVMWFECNQMQMCYVVEEVVFFVDVVCQYVECMFDQLLLLCVWFVVFDSFDVLKGGDLGLLLLLKWFCDDVSECMLFGMQVEIGMFGYLLVLWVKELVDCNWIVVLVQLLWLLCLFDWMLLWFGMIFLVGVIVVLFVVWQLQQLLCLFVCVVVCFGCGQLVLLLCECGLCELCQFMYGFNQMVEQVLQVESDCVVMLVGVVYDLCMLFVWMCLCVEMMDDVWLCDGVV